MDNFDLTKFLAEGKLYEFTSAQDTEDIAGMVADAFTEESADEGEYLRYSVGRVEGQFFELDTDLTSQSPKDIDTRGVGEGWGGNFGIKPTEDGYEVRNAEKGGLVATIDNEGKFRMLSADESRAEMGLEEAKEETKSNKMKKSELKEMIKSAFLNEKETFDQAFDRIDKSKEVYQGSDKDEVKETLVDEDQDMADAILNALGGEAAFEAVVRAMSTDDAKVYLGGIMRDYDIEMGEPDEIPGFEGTKDALDALSIREEEEEDVEVDAEEVDVDVDVDTETEDAGDMEVSANAEAGLTGEKKDVQDNLEAALEAAKALGDQKLVDQIGNSITFFTRQHVVGKAETMEEGNKEYYKDAEADDAEHIKALEKDMKDDKEDSMKVNEVEFPMWTKIKNK